MRALRDLALSATAAALIAPGGAAADLLTLAESIAFDFDGVVGNMDPVSAEQAAGFDFSGSGEVSGAGVGAHVCNDGVGFFDSCFNPTGDLFVYTVTLGGTSAALDNVSIFISGSSLARDWSGYVVDDDAATREPDGTIFVSGGRGVVFQDFTAPEDTSAWLQPGEPTVVLITAFASGLPAEIAGGATLGARFFRPGNTTPFDFPLTPVEVPEPGALSLLARGAERA